MTCEQNLFCLFIIIIQFVIDAGLAILIDVYLPVLRLFLDLLPLFLGEQFSKGELQRPEELNPLDDFELALDSMICRVCGTVFLRMTAKATVADHKNAL